MIRVIAACLAVFAGQAVAAESLPPLSEVAHIRGPLVAAAVAYEVEQGCSEIERREVRVAIEGWKLVLRAQSLGYSTREIKTYVKDDDIVATLREVARQRILSSGVSLDDEMQLCAYGDRLITARKLTGSLLRKK